MWYEITYPIPNFNGVAIEVWEWISNFISHFTPGMSLQMTMIAAEHESDLKVTHNKVEQTPQIANHIPRLNHVNKRAMECLLRGYWRKITL